MTLQYNITNQTLKNGLNYNNYLVSSTHHIQVMFLQELSQNILTKHKTDPPFIRTPT